MPRLGGAILDRACFRTIKELRELDLQRIRRFLVGAGVAAASELRSDLSLVSSIRRTTLRFALKPVKALEQKSPVASRQIIVSELIACLPDLPLDN